MGQETSAPPPVPETGPWLAVSTPLRMSGRLLGTLGGVFLGAVFLVAAWAKTLDPAAFAVQVERERLDFLLPAPAVAAVALALEVFLGGALLLGVRRPFILWPTAALVVFFLFLTGRTYWQDLNGTLAEDAAGCGCFGNLVERTPAEAFWQDLLLMVPALLLAFVARRAEPAWPHSEEPPRRRLGLAGLLTAATLLLAWKAPDLPLDDLATRLKPGVDPLALCAGSAGDGSSVCMDDILPELAEGEHLVVLADLADDSFGEDVDRLNEYHWAGSGPRLWVATAASEEELFTFRFTRGPAFTIRETPAALLAPLYRTLPRSFLVSQGRVAETWNGLPPLQQWDIPDAAAAGDTE